MGVKTIFKEDDSFMDASLEISLTNDLKKLKICIEYEDDNEHPKSIILNKFDSVKLAKELRRLISMLEV
jgi:hypothetical protein